MKKIIVLAIILSSMPLQILSSKDNPALGLIIFTSVIGMHQYSHSLGKCLRSNFYDTTKDQKNNTVVTSPDTIHNSKADIDASQAHILAVCNGKGKYGSRLDEHDTTIQTEQAAANVCFAIYNQEPSRQLAVLNAQSQSPVQRSLVPIAKIASENDDMKKMVEDTMQAGDEKHKQVFQALPKLTFLLPLVEENLSPSVSPNNFYNGSPEVDNELGESYVFPKSTSFKSNKN